MGKPKLLQPGERFHRWTVVAFSHIRNTYYWYLCKCDCGTEKAVNGSELRKGKSKSCGCHRRERAAEMGRRTPVRVRLEGQRFGRWVVLGLAPRESGRKHLWLCRCDCGTEKAVSPSDLRGGKSQSCGCARNQQTAERCTVHGHARAGQHTREHRIWMSMRNRCQNPKAINYRYYGARGIKVCARWLDFTNFLADMGPIPAPLSIDRIDVDGDYCPENCRLATPTQQAMNKRKG